MDPILREMLRQAVSAAKDGDLETALTLVRNVLKEEPDSVQAWLLMARIVKDDYEKRVALANVLQIDPNNETAQKMLNQLDVKSGGNLKSSEILPGISRRMVIMLGIVLVFVLMGVFIVMNNINSNNEKQRLQEIAARQTELFRPTKIVLDVTYDAMTAESHATETYARIFETNSPTPTITPTSPLPTLPNSPTPTPTITPTLTPIPPPDTLIGSLVGMSGRDPEGNNLALVEFEISQREPVPVNGLEGQSIQIFPDLMRYLYIVYSSDTFSNRFMVYNRETGANDPLVLTRADVAFDNPTVVTLSTDGDRMLYLADRFIAPGKAIYLYQFSTDNLQQLALDDAIYSDPAISPNGGQAVAVRKVTGGDNPGVDLVLIDLATGVPTSLTTDRDALIESRPRWSADGAFIFYEGLAEGREDHDIYVMTPSNPGAGLARIETAADEVMPIPDPTGRYLAYASNPSGRRYDVFVFDLTAGISFQQTADNGEQNDFPTDWR